MANILSQIGNTLQMATPAGQDRLYKQQVQQMALAQQQQELQQQQALAAIGERLRQNPELANDPGALIREVVIADPSKVGALTSWAAAQQKAQPEYAVADGVAYNKNDPTDNYRLPGTGQEKPPLTTGLPEGQYWAKDAAGNWTAAPIPGVGGAGTVNIKAEADLRKEADGLNKDFRVIKDAYKGIETAAKSATPAGDISLIFQYMKILDPGSTVREGEFATAQQATGVPGQVLNAYNKAIEGIRLNPAQRQDFVGQARNLYESRAQSYNESAEKYRGLAKDYGLNPDRIITPVDVPKAPQKKLGELSTDEIKARIAKLKGTK